MNALFQFEPTRLWLEIGFDRLSAWRNQDGKEIPLERNESGRFTEACMATVANELLHLLRGKPPFSRLKIHASISSRGVILRSVLVPKSAAPEWPRLVALQLEAEFPLPPEQLAWGWLPIPGNSADYQPIMLAAVRKDSLQPYQDLLAPLDGELQFSLAAFDRLELISSTSAAAVAIQLGTSETEVSVRLNGHPTAIRWLPAVGETAAQEIHPFLESLDLPPNTVVSLHQAAVVAGIMPPTPDWIRVAIPSNVAWPQDNPVEPPRGIGQTAANLGLARMRTADPHGHKLVLKAVAVEGPLVKLGAFPWKRLALVAGILGAIFLTPYLEALILAPRLQRQLARIKNEQPQLTIIDRELDFLRHLQENQGPFLDTVYLIAASAPPGCHINGLNLNRRGEVSLSGYLQNMNQVGEFRSKLIESGFFSTVVVEDQTPTPDRQRINFRVTAQWKAASDREGLEIGPKLTNSTTVSAAQRLIPQAAKSIPTFPAP